MHAAARTSSQPWAIGHDTRVLRFSDTREHAADKSCLHDETSRPETLSVSACWVRTASNDRDLPTRAFRSYFICTRAVWDHLACGSLGQVQRHLTVAFSNSAKSISTCRSIVCVRRRTVFCKGQSHSGLAPESCSRCFAIYSRTKRRDSKAALPREISAPAPCHFYPTATRAPCFGPHSK